MKKQTILSVALIMLMFYIGGAVSSASFLITHWSDEVRGTIAASWIFVTIIYFAQLDINKKT